MFFKQWSIQLAVKCYAQFYYNISKTYLLGVVWMKSTETQQCNEQKNINHFSSVLPTRFCQNINTSDTWWTQLKWYSSFAVCFISCRLMRCHSMPIIQCQWVNMNKSFELYQVMNIKGPVNPVHPNSDINFTDQQNFLILKKPNVNCNFVRLVQ